MDPHGLSALESLDLSGRAFRAREGLTDLRGWVVKTGFNGLYATIEVRDVERKRADDAAWSKVEDFDAYQGISDITSVRVDPDESVTVSITYIGRVKILPPGVAP